MEKRTNGWVVPTKKEKKTEHNPKQGSLVDRPRLGHENGPGSCRIHSATPIEDCSLVDCFWASECFNTSTL